MAFPRICGLGAERPAAWPLPPNLGMAATLAAPQEANPTRPKSQGPDGWQPRIGASHTRAGRASTRGMSSRGGRGAPGYVPPNAGQAGAAQHRTERWEPRAEGRQEGTLKPLVGNQPQPHHTTRGACFSHRELPGAYGTWASSCRAMCAARARRSAVDAAGRPPADGARASAVAVGSGAASHRAASA